ncbi:MAG: GNAT family N-acetyltransferase [Candidatus Roizmanbacteria bacterium]|nr:GNAT family N-acetyltransferase [Candidatus Roizmanbacteria bacterium]
MDNLIVREANIGDVSGIAKIHVETWQYAYRGQLPDAFLDSLSIEKRQKVWREELSNPQSNVKIYVGEIESKIVGFCSLGKSRDDDADESMGELYAIYIDSHYMNSGIGSALIQKGLEYLKDVGFKKATLWVLTSNKKTRMFYEHKGWSAGGKTKTDQREGFVLHETRYTIDLG